MKKRFWKIMPKDSTRNGYTFKEGLNVDPKAVPLDKIGSCEPGAFYFTDDAHVYEFLSYGGYAREVTLPEGEPIRADGDNKWKAHRIICGPLLSLGELLAIVPFPAKVGVSLYLRGCTLPEGLKLPDEVGGSLYLSGCTLPEGLKLPDKVGGYLYLFGCTLPEGFKLPEHLAGSVIR